MPRLSFLYKQTRGARRARWRAAPHAPRGSGRRGRSPGRGRVSGLLPLPPSSPPALPPPPSCGAPSGRRQSAHDPGRNDTAPPPRGARRPLLRSRRRPDPRAVLPGRVREPSTRGAQGRAGGVPDWDKSGGRGDGGAGWGEHERLGLPGSELYFLPPGLKPRGVELVLNAFNTC